MNYDYLSDLNINYGTKKLACVEPRTRKVLFKLAIAIFLQLRTNYTSMDYIVSAKSYDFYRKVVPKFYVMKSWFYTNSRYILTREDNGIFWRFSCQSISCIIISTCKRAGMKFSLWKLNSSIPIPPIWTVVLRVKSNSRKPPRNNVPPKWVEIITFVGFMALIKCRQRGISSFSNPPEPLIKISIKLANWRNVPWISQYQDFPRSIWPAKRSEALELWLIFNWNVGFRSLRELYPFNSSG